jgi:hypothetical protein
MQREPCGLDGQSYRWWQPWAYVAVVVIVAAAWLFLLRDVAVSNEGDFSLTTGLW